MVEKGKQYLITFVQVFEWRHHQAELITTSRVPDLISFQGCSRGRH